MMRAGQVVLLDSIGELASVSSLAGVAFVGGSVAEAGGHNPLEPAQFGVPIVMGPHYANFRAITEDLLAHDAVLIARREELAGALAELLTNTDEARAMGERARRVFEAVTTGPAQELKRGRRKRDCGRATYRGPTEYGRGWIVGGGLRLIFCGRGAKYVIHSIGWRSVDSYSSAQ